MKVVVFGGAGNIGSGGAEAIAKREGITEVIVADVNLKGAQQVAAKIGKQAKAVYVDLNNEDSLAEVLRGADLAMSFAGPTVLYSPLALKAANKARTNYVDITDDTEAIEALLAWDKTAKDTGVTALCTFGVSPGVTNLFAKHGADRLDKVANIHIAGVARTLEQPGSGVWGHRISMFSSETPVLRDGKITHVPGGSGAEVVEWPEPIGALEVYAVNHSEPITLPRYLKGVENITTKIAFNPKETNELLLKQVRWGFASMVPVKVGEIEISPYDFARYFFTSDQFRQTNTWKTILDKEKATGPVMGFRVVVEGEKDGNPVRYVYSLFSRDGNKTIYMPAVVAAYMIGTGKIKQQGVLLPEALNSDSVDVMLKELEKSGVPWSVEEEDLS